MYAHCLLGYAAKEFDMKTEEGKTLKDSKLVKTFVLDTNVSP